MAVQAFALPYSEAAVEDLRQRLARTRWPDTIAGSHWDYGVSLDYMKELCRYWQYEFDWKRQIEKMSAFHHYRYTPPRGLGIHFIHERGKGPAPIPLILTHGWPSSFLEMLKIIPMLADPASYSADPADAFDVIVPSLRGYGFSDRTTEPGVNTFRIADIWFELMSELRYDRFAAQGGDWGTDVTTLLGLRHPQRIIGIHLNSIPPYQPYLEPGSVLSDAEQAFLEEERRWYEKFGAYDHLQKTTPQTLAFALNDSPAGLAAWILEKFRDWSDCDGDLERCFTKDELLANITLYWMTETIHSSCRLYYEDARAPLQFQKGDYVSVPCGIALFTKRDGPPPPRRWVERAFNVHRWTEIPRGGHFPALEEPELLVDDIRSFFRPLR
jgi:pimeloyl-ACP methyl ester carboxylesterase